MKSRKGEERKCPLNILGNQRKNTSFPTFSNQNCSCPEAGTVQGGSIRASALFSGMSAIPGKSSKGHFSHPTSSKVSFWDARNIGNCSLQDKIGIALRITASAFRSLASRLTKWSHGSLKVTSNKRTRQFLSWPAMDNLELCKQLQGSQFGAFHSALLALEWLP